MVSGDETPQEEEEDEEEKEEEDKTTNSTTHSINETRQGNKHNIKTNK